MAPPGMAEQRHVRVAGAGPAQLAFEVVDLEVEALDQGQAGLGAFLPGVGKREPGEQCAPFWLKSLRSLGPSSSCRFLDNHAEGA